jgi:Protein of unknown function (DUF3106)
MEEEASSVRFARLISVLAIALMMALPAECARVQRRAPQFKPAKPPPARANGEPKNQKANNQARKNGGGQGARNGAGNGAGNRGGNGTGPGANGGNGQNSVARPPNEQLFKPNPNVVRPNGQQAFNRPNNLPAGAEQRLRDMSPQEQERFLQNNQRFQNLPPERQAQIRQNLQKWNSLSPAEKDRLNHAEDRWRQMTPQQRDLYQNHILPRWQQMSPDRRQLINGRLHTLQAMPPNAQQRALNDPKFMQGLSPDEQDTLRNLVSLRNPNP